MVFTCKNGLELAPVGSLYQSGTELLMLLSIPGRITQFITNEHFSLAFFPQGSSIKKNFALRHLQSCCIFTLEDLALPSPPPYCTSLIMSHSCKEEECQPPTCPQPCICGASPLYLLQIWKRLLVLSSLINSDI